MYDREAKMSSVAAQPVASGANMHGWPEGYLTVTDSYDKIQKATKGQVNFNIVSSFNN